MFSEKYQVRSVLLHEFRLGSTPTETKRKVDVTFAPKGISLSSVEKWFSKFRSGDTSIEDAPRSGRPSTLDDLLLAKAIEEDPKLTTADLAVMFNCSDETIRTHLHAIGKTCKLEKWIPYDLTDDQKINRVTICNSLLSRHEKCIFLNRLLTSDEKWVAYDNSKRGRVWTDRGGPSTSTAKPSIHAKKHLLCVWWSGYGIVHWELLNTGQTINAGLYCEQLQRVAAKLPNIMPRATNRDGIVYLHDNARPHTASITRQKLKELQWDILPHPAYSPDLAPSDFWLFLNLDNYLRNKKFSSKVEVENALEYFFRGCKPQFLRKGLEKLPEKWLNVIENNGEYCD